MNAALIAVPAAALLLLLAGKGKAAAPKGAAAVASVAQRMANVLATNNPAAIRLEAGRLRLDGYSTQASDLEKAAAVLESEQRPAAAAPPVVVAPSPGKPPATVLAPPKPLGAAPAPPAVVAPPPPSSGVAGRAPTITAQLRSLPALLGVQFEGTGKSTKQVFRAPRSAGQAVKDWQTVLVELGFMTAAPDGKFGSATEVATRAFQTAANESARRSGKPLLDADGVVGPKTVARAAEARVISGGPSTFSGEEMFGFDPQPDTPLPGVIPPMTPTAPNPRRALASRLLNHLSMAPAGGEDRTLVMLYQQQEGLKPTGFYGPSVALSLARSYGLVPPKPLYWTESRTSKSKSNYRDTLRAIAAGDPQRAEEWFRASNV
jgi:peptidoglycan hydrolase-like protein with peptidoglycan-binding domain